MSSHNYTPPEAVKAEAALLTAADFDGVDGVILDAKIHEVASRDRTVAIAWGYVYGDRKLRFEDGALIHTSYFTEPPVGDVYKTRNSIYRIRLRPEPADDLA